MMKSPAEMPGFLFVLARNVLPSSQKITSTYPRSPNLAYPSRVLSGGNASGNLRKSGKDRRFGLAGRKTCRVEEVSPLCQSFTGPERSGEAAGQGENTNRRGGWSLDRKHRIRTTPRPAFQGPPVILFFQWSDAKAGVARGETGHSSLSAGGGLKHFGFHRCIKPWKDCHTNAIMRKYAPSGTNQSK